jgi:hypothetical protein
VREERREPRSFWVYLPSFPDADAARARVAELRAAGVEDVMRVLQGPDLNAVSLGLYNREASAERRAENLRARGVEPRIEPRFDTVEVVFLALETPLAPADLPLPPAQRDALEPCP